jgi:hypothetical protein
MLQRSTTLSGDEISSNIQSGRDTIIVEKAREITIDEINQNRTNIHDDKHETMVNHVPKKRRSPFVMVPPLHLHKILSPYMSRNQLGVSSRSCIKYMDVD